MLSKLSSLWTVNQEGNYQEKEKNKVATKAVIVQDCMHPSLFESYNDPLTYLFLSLNEEHFWLWQGLSTETHVFFMQGG